MQRGGGGSPRAASVRGPQQSVIPRQASSTGASSSSQSQRSRANSAPDGRSLRGGEETPFQKTRNDVRREKKQHQHQQHGSRRQHGPIIDQTTDTGLPSSALPNHSFFISRVHNSVGLQRIAQHIRNQGVDLLS